MSIEEVFVINGQEGQLVVLERRAVILLGSEIVYEVESLQFVESELDFLGHGVHFQLLLHGLVLGLEAEVIGEEVSLDHTVHVHVVDFLKT